MSGDTNEHLEIYPFQPFTIHMADGRYIHVPTRDHINIVGTRAQVLQDNEDLDILPGLVMAGLTIHASQPPRQEEEHETIL